MWRLSAASVSRSTRFMKHSFRDDGTYVTTSPSRLSSTSGTPVSISASLSATPFAVARSTSACQLKKRRVSDGTPDDGDRGHSTSPPHKQHTCW